MSVLVLYLMFRLSFLTWITALVTDGGMAITFFISLSVRECFLLRYVFVDVLHSQFDVNCREHIHSHGKPAFSCITYVIHTHVIHV